MERADLTATIAYSLFEHRGSAHGRDQDDWFAAEKLVESCLTVLRALKTKKRPAASPAPVRADSSVEGEAMRLLAEASGRDGRAATSAVLGYSSTSVVSALLRGKRALDEDLVERIFEAFSSDGLPDKSQGRRRAG